jgi:DNA-directed RNA polymerase specialized sigma24 family protein
MGKACPELAQFACIASLMEHQHAHVGEPAARFSVVRALVSAAQTDQPFRSTAHIMVVLALWPGLDAVLWRLARGFPDARDDLPTEILARVGEAILVLDLGRVTAVVATLLRNVERNIRRDLIAKRLIGEALRPIDDPAVEALVSKAAVAIAFTRDGIADHLAELGSEDANLLSRIFILGETQEQAGQSLGLTPSAARKRYQRALAKIRSPQKFLPALSHSGAAVGL